MGHLSSIDGELLRARSGVADGWLVEMVDDHGENRRLRAPACRVEGGVERRSLGGAERCVEGGRGERGQEAHTALPDSAICDHTPSIAGHAGRPTPETLDINPTSEAPDRQSPDRNTRH
jgi:hypothetical protein